MSDPQGAGHRLHTPTSELPHPEKVRRERMHIRILTLVLIAVLAMLAYAAAFDLDSWAEWVVLGMICFTAVGAMVAVHRN